MHKILLVKSNSQINSHFNQKKKKKYFQSLNDYHINLKTCINRVL